MGKGKWDVAGSECDITFWDDKNVLKLDSGDSQLSGYTKNHHFKRVNFVI